MLEDIDMDKENMSPGFMEQACPPASPSPGFHGTSIFSNVPIFPSPKKKSLHKRVLSESTPTTASSKCSLGLEALRFDDESSYGSPTNQDSWTPQIPVMRSTKRKTSDNEGGVVDSRDERGLMIPLLVRDSRLQNGQCSSSRYYKKTRDDVQNVSFFGEELTGVKNLTLHPRPLRGTVRPREDEPTMFGSKLSSFPELGGETTQPRLSTPPSTPKGPRVNGFASADKMNSRVFLSPQSTRPTVSVNPFSPVTQRHLDSGVNAPATCPSRIFGTPNRKMTRSKVYGDDAHRMDWLHPSCPPSPQFAPPPQSVYQCPETPSRLSSSRQRFGPGNNGGNDVDISINSNFSISSPLVMQSSRFETDFELLKTIGVGSFGTVHEVAARLDGCLYAVKVMKRPIRGGTDRRIVLKEVHALSALCDQSKEGTFHIVRYHQAWIEDDRLYIQTELCDRTLGQEMEETQLPSAKDERTIWKLLREILLALDLIHSNNMAHLDIKPDNIFTKDGKYKIGDFGLAQVSCNNTDAEEGDQRYMAHELLSETSGCDLTKCDIFSLGITVFEIMMGSKLPSNGKDWHELRGGNVFSTFIGSKSQQISPALKETLNSMLHPNPDERPSAASLLERQELLSDEKRELLIEKERVRVANEALGAQRLDFERRLCGKPMSGVTMSRPIRQRLGKPISSDTVSRPLRRSSAL